MILSDFKDYIHVPKIWGEEIWLTNSDKYCAKFLTLKDGFQCSLHRHLVKTETFFVLDGTVILEIQTGTNQKFKQSVRLEAGENYHIPVGVFHRFSTQGHGPATILEVSTQHDDMDVERLEESREV
jgi:mannose-6-phosphate isomerase-like protein (cupin superfamily)